jgi:hypothetical protein
MRNPKKFKPDAMSQNLLTEAIAQNGAVLPVMIMMMLIILNDRINFK